MSVEIVQSKRLRELPPYIFSEINKIKAAATAKGIELLSLGIGDPDRPTPTQIVEKLQEAVKNPANHVYSPYNGTDQFRQSVSKWFKKRFNVALDPATEVVALIGSKEGIAHFPVAFCDPGDVCLFPNPGYPVFSSSIHLGGGVPVGIPMRAENGFLPDPAELEGLLKKHSPKYMILNFPSNPTSAVCSLDLMEKLVALAKKYGTYIVSDNAYSEMYYDENKKPHSFLEVDGAKDIVIEFHSLSKTFNMTGWRIAFAVGNADLVGGLLSAKTQIDSGPLLSVQEGAAYALDNYDSIVPAIRQVYAERKAVLLKGLDEMGIEYQPLDASFFLWAKIPNGENGMEFTRNLIEKQGLVVTPGVGFGSEGEGYFRLAMTVDIPHIEEALKKLKAYLG